MPIQFFSSASATSRPYLIEKFLLLLIEIFWKCFLYPFSRLRETIFHPNVMGNSFRDCKTKLFAETKFSEANCWIGIAALLFVNTMKKFRVFLRWNWYFWMSIQYICGSEERNDFFPLILVEILSKLECDCRGNWALTNKIQQIVSSDVSFSYIYSYITE